MMTNIYLIIYFLICTILGYFFFKNYSNFAKKIDIIDDKNKNYNHKPTPTGSGLIFVFLFLIGNCIFYVFDLNFISVLPNRYYLFIVSVIILCVVSFIDDRTAVDPILRLILQILATYISLACIDLNSVGLPLKVTLLFSLILWIYIVNIANFLDGSDGFLINIFLFVSINIFIINHFIETLLFSPNLFLILMPAVIIFIYFNFPPAKLYMGDTGSIFFGFIIGFATLELISQNYIKLAFAIVAYPLTDCTITLVKKLKKGIMPWIGMYDYYFLIPTLKNKVNHKNVLLISIIFNIFNTINIFLLLIYDNFIFLILIYLFCLLQILIYSQLEYRFKKLKFFK